MNAKKASSKDVVIEGKHLPRTLKSATCKSLSGRSTLGYEIGVTPDKEIHVRIRSNSGPGSCGLDWVALRTVQQVLAKASLPITSGTLNKIFVGKSQNTSGFVLAALFHEGLLKPHGDTRGYEPTDGAEFMREVGRLLDKGPPVAESTTKKADAPMPPSKKAPATPKAKAVKK